jgi:hypothetical protein
MRKGLCNATSFLLSILRMSLKFVLMKRNLLLFLTLLFCASCSKENRYSPDQYLSKENKENIIRKTIRYSTNLAPQATHENKLESQFDDYYETALKEYELVAYYPANDSAYFLFARQARSVTPMKEAIGGKLLLKEDSLVYYEEVFRTWKMNQDTLKERSFKLFDRMVRKQDLSLYYSKFQGDKYIEFPDERFYFDVADRMWHDRESNSLK